MSMPMEGKQLNFSVIFTDSGIIEEELDNTPMKNDLKKLYKQHFEEIYVLASEGRESRFLKEWIKRTLSILKKDSYFLNEDLEKAHKRMNQVLKNYKKAKQKIKGPITRDMKNEMINKHRIAMELVEKTIIDIVKSIDQICIPNSVLNSNHNTVKSIDNSPKAIGDEFIQSVSNELYSGDHFIDDIISGTMRIASLNHLETREINSKVQELKNAYLKYIKADVKKDSNILYFPDPAFIGSSMVHAINSFVINYENQPIDQFLRKFVVFNNFKNDSRKWVCFPRDTIFHQMPKYNEGGIKSYKVEDD